MSMPADIPASAQANEGGERRRHRHRRSRRGGAAGVQDAGQAAADPQTARQGQQSHVNVAPRAPILSQVPPHAVTSQDSRNMLNTSAPPARNGVGEPPTRGNGRRRGGGGRGGRPPREAQPQRQVMGGLGGRSFGGQLTGSRPAQNNNAPPDLQPDAPAFTPGQPVAPRQQQQQARMPRQPKEKQRRYSKSQAEDIMTRTHEDILHGLYECPICCAEVMKNSKVWSCKTCWTVFHLQCVKKWAQNEGSTQRNNEPVPEAELPPERQWRCPGCNLPKDVLPKEYTCWCAKEINPKAIPGLPPHSCGNTCGKTRKCPHPCELMCHAGPCPPCPRMGPKTSCFCHKNEVAKKCVDTDYEHGWSCGQACGELLACGEHRCERACHEGPCGKCEVLVEAKCYCGKEDKEIFCSERGKKKESALPKEDGEVDSWTGSFQCGKTCNRSFGCGKHSCSKPCHEQSVDAPHCPKSPDIVKNCPCGKTSLGDIGCVRTSCEDPIPHCEKICRKQLPCGHECQKKCHEGSCYPCLKTVTIDCRCGRTTSNTICHQGLEEHPQCMRICRITLSCGRHECGERCCAGEQAAAARNAARKKLKGVARGTPEDYEPQHVCLRTCDRELKCGNPEHRCQNFCHRGPCRSCREAVFEEIACNCGRTVLYPPQPCGTKPPPCSYQCKRPKSCGHPPSQHNCHDDEESCPKCPYLVQKTCMCGKKVLKNQPCWSQNVSCGQTCEHRLRCGIHFCRKLCHRPGDCEDAALAHCPQICGKTKTAEACGHPCLDVCHAPYPCKEDKPCPAKVIITCACQHIKQEVKCGAMKADPVLERKILSCDDECLRLQRNAKLAAALNIDPNHEDTHIPYSAATLDYFKDHVKWCQTQEREFRVFAADDSEKRLRFKPMQASQRAFLHSLAEDFGLDSEGVDPEPHRHVVVFKTPNFVKAPMKTLSQCKRVAPVMEEESKKKPSANAVAFNAIVISEPRFALTIDELRADLAADSKTEAVAGWKIEFLPSEEIVLHGTLANGVDESTVQRLKPLIADVAKAKELAKSTALCAIDSSLNVIRREEDMFSNAGGWSHVVKSAGSGRKQIAKPVAQNRNAFAILGGNRIAERKAKEKEEARKRKAAEEALKESWEDEVDEAEEVERAESGKAMSEKAMSEKAESVNGESALAQSKKAESVHGEGRESTPETESKEKAPEMAEN